MSLIPQDSPGLTIEKRPTPKRTERLENGSLMLGNKLGVIARVSLYADIALGNVTRSEPNGITEHLPDEEVEFVSPIVQLVNLTPGMVLEIWEKIYETDQYRVTRYKKIR